MLTFVALVVVLREVGVDVQALLVSAGVLGLAVGLGAQSLIKDVITGFFILFEGLIGVGDVIEVGGAYGHRGSHRPAGDEGPPAERRPARDPQRRDHPVRQLQQGLGPGGGRRRASATTPTSTAALAALERIGAEWAARERAGRSSRPRSRASSASASPIWASGSRVKVDADASLCRGGRAAPPDPRGLRARRHQLLSPTRRLCSGADLAMTRVKKAVFPAAGLGTRFLPATKAQPKEMLPLVDTPTIQYVVEEAVASGLDGDHPRHRAATSAPSRITSTPPSSSSTTCQDRGKLEELAQIKTISELASVSYVRQKEPLGLGHAILCARPAGRGRAVRRVPAATTSSSSRVPCMRQLLDVFERHGGPVLAVMRMPREEIGRYGVIAPRDLGGNVYEVMDLVEKPNPAEAPSDLAIIGRYVLTPDLFPILADVASRLARRDPAHEWAPRAAVPAPDLRRRVRGQAPRHGREARLSQGHRRIRAGAARSGRCLSRLSPRAEL